MQAGGADILHIHFAQHLGCEYFVAFDRDFKRVRLVIEGFAKLKLLSSPEQVLATL